METHLWTRAVALGFLLATLMDTSAVRGLFRFVGWQARREAPRCRAAGTGEGGPGLMGLRLVRAGKELPGRRWFGLLKRATIYAYVATGLPAGIAVVMMVKGFGCYPELRTPDTAKGEWFIIETLANPLQVSPWARLVLLLRVHPKTG